MEISLSDCWSQVGAVAPLSASVDRLDDGLQCLFDRGLIDRLGGSGILEQPDERVTDAVQ